MVSFGYYAMYNRWIELLYDLMTGFTYQPVVNPPCLFSLVPRARVCMFDTCLE